MKSQTVGRWYEDELSDSKDVSEFSQIVESFGRVLMLSFIFAKNFGRKCSDCQKFCPNTFIHKNMAPAVPVHTDLNLFDQNNQFVIILLSIIKPMSSILAFTVMLAQATSKCWHSKGIVGNLFPTQADNVMPVKREAIAKLLHIDGTRPQALCILQFYSLYTSFCSSSSHFACKL